MTYLAETVELEVLARVANTIEDNGSDCSYVALVGDTKRAYFNLRDYFPNHLYDDNLQTIFFEVNHFDCNLQEEANEYRAEFKEEFDYDNACSTLVGNEILDYFSNQLDAIEEYEAEMNSDEDLVYDNCEIVLAIEIAETVGSHKETVCDIDGSVFYNYKGHELEEDSGNNNEIWVACVEEWAANLEIAKQLIDTYEGYIAKYGYKVDNKFEGSATYNEDGVKEVVHGTCTVMSIIFEVGKVSLYVDVE